MTRAPRPHVRALCGSITERRWLNRAAVVGLVFVTTACGRAKNACDQALDPPFGSNASADPAPDSASAAQYAIGVDDVLTVQFWGQKDLNAEVTVRPDGRVTVPLLNDVQAAGLTPEQLRDNIMEAAKKFVEDPNVTVTIKQINSRKVFITGEVEKPGPYPLNGTTTIVQLIAMAGGLRSFADSKKISLMRTEGVRQVSYGFNYQEVIKRRNLRQNIELKPGDTVFVP